MEEMNEIHAADDLEAIKGIGEKTAGALNRIGILRYADLDEYTAASLSLALKEKTDRKISAKKIKQDDWLGQANRFATQFADEHATTLASKTAVNESDNQSTASGWRQHAGFSIFFDYEVDPDGKQNWQTRIWQTRVYHDETGEQVELSGIEPEIWANWIVEKAQLPVQLTSILPDVVAEPSAIESEVHDLLEARLDILDVHISEVAPSEALPNKCLRSEIHYQLSGANLMRLVSQVELPPLHLDVEAVDLQTGTADLIESSKLTLKADVYEYVSELTLPLPKIGNYKLQHNLSLNLPRGAVTAFYEGPVLKVIP